MDYTESILERFPFLQDIVAPSWLVYVILVGILVLFWLTRANRDDEEPAVTLGVMIGFIVLSLAEVYLLIGWKEHHLSFLMPSEAGGWWRVLLNGGIYVTATCLQTYTFVGTLAALHDGKFMPGYVCGSLGAAAFILGLPISSLFFKNDMTIAIYIFLGFQALQVLVTLFLSFGRDNPLQFVVEIPFYLIGLISTTLMLALLAMIAVGIVLLVLILGFCFRAFSGTLSIVHTPTRICCGNCTWYHHDHYCTRTGETCYSDSKRYTCSYYTEK